MLPAPLYLDTARLGTMSPGAQRLHNQFVRLAAEQPSSLYVEEFLKRGFGAWPPEYQQRYAGLASWNGIAGLRDQLARFISTSRRGRVILASRSTALMRLAARQLCERCRHILTTDLSWRPYQRILRRVARRRGGTRITTIPVRRSVLRDGITPDELINRMTRAFVRNQCDGLFLPIVDNLGIRLPVARIVDAIRSQAHVRYVVGDAAQATGHVDWNDDATACDMLIAGTHKWLGAYLPMGIGWINKQSTSARIGDQRLPVDRMSDPLFQFTEQLGGGHLARHTETVNLTPLFACRGALDNVCRNGCGPRADMSARRKQTELAAMLARLSAWEPLMPGEPFWTSILLLRCPGWSGASPDELRSAFATRGVNLTAYAGGLVRLSFPLRPLRLIDWHRLQSALSAVASPSRGRTRTDRDLVARRYSLESRHPDAHQSQTNITGDLQALAVGNRPIV